MIGERELKNLTDTIMEIYGWDFRDYAASSLGRRIQRLMDLKKIPSVEDLVEKIQAEEWIKQELLDQITVNVTEMFREPEAWVKLRKHVLPEIQKKNDRISIFHAGCSSGEEVFSMAIMLKEMGLYDQSEIHAADIDQTIINNAHEGIYSMNKMELYTKNYYAAEGENELLKYYTKKGNNAIMDPGLLDNVQFEIFDLVKDPPKGKYHLILCRNVLIYFNQLLQNKVLQKLYDSLHPGGFLCIGTKESLLWVENSNRFKVLDQSQKIYQRPV